MAYKWIPITIMAKEEKERKKKENLTFVKFKRKSLACVKFQPKYGISDCLAEISEFGTGLRILLDEASVKTENF